MLERLIDILNDGGTHSIADLSQRLTISTTMVEMMMEDLARMGYLSPWEVACDSKCDSCPMGSCRVVEASGRVWTFKDREQDKGQCYEQ